MRRKAGLDLEDVDALRDQPFGERQILFEVGIGDRDAQRHVAAIVAAEQLGDRHAKVLAHNIEQGHLHGRLALGMANDGLFDLAHQRRDLERVGADQQGAKIVMNADGIGLSRAGEDRPGATSPHPTTPILVLIFNNGAGNRFLDVADAMPALHLERPAHHVDRDVGDT